MKENLPCLYLIGGCFQWRAKQEGEGLLALPSLLSDCSKHSWLQEMVMTCSDTGDETQA